MTARITDAGSTTGRAGLHPAVLIEVFGLRAGPAVWSYRDAVVGASQRLSLEVDHSVGLVQIGLRLSQQPDILIGWRIDTGWYCSRGPRRGEPPAVGPTCYRPDTDPVERLLPRPAEAARWLEQGSTGQWRCTSDPPWPTTGDQTNRLLERLSGFLPASGS